MPDGSLRHLGRRSLCGVLAFEFFLYCDFFVFAGCLLLKEGRVQIGRSGSEAYGQKNNVIEFALISEAVRPDDDLTRVVILQTRSIFLLFCTQHLQYISVEIKPLSHTRVATRATICSLLRPEENDDEICLSELESQDGQSGATCMQLRLSSRRSICSTGGNSPKEGGHAVVIVTGSQRRSLWSDRPLEPMVRTSHL